MGYKNFTKAAVVLAGFALSAGAQAATGYCSGGPLQTDGLSVSDVTYGVNGPATTTTNATDCYGIAPVAGNPSDEQNAINALKWGGTFDFLAKTGQNDSGLGYNWSLTANTNQVNGTYTLSVVPSATINPAMVIDFVFLLKASNSFVAYFFDNVSFDGSSGGSFSVAIPANQNNFAQLSHMSVFGRTGGTPPDITVPEPGTLALAGLALLGVGAARRRWKA